jgi:predicted DNA-binding ribbon-helix-helix protein
LFGREARVGTTISKNVFVGKQRTSVRLELVEWEALAEICEERNCRIRDLCLEISGNREENSSFTSSLRIYMLTYYRNKAARLAQDREGPPLSDNE